MSDNVVGIAGDRIRSIVERIEHIEEEIKALNEGKKEVFLEAKGDGFDVKFIKEILRLRKQDRSRWGRGETHGIYRDRRTRMNVTSTSRCSTSISRLWNLPSKNQRRPREIVGSGVLTAPFLFVSANLLAHCCLTPTARPGA